MARRAAGARRAFQAHFAAPPLLSAAHAHSPAPNRPQVFERAPGLQQRGAGVALHPNGSKALRAIDPEIAARVAATSLVECVVATLGPDVRRDLNTS